MTNTLSTVFSRTNIMNALLALCTAIEFCYDMGERFGTWYRNGGDQQIRTVLTNIIAAIIWTVETAKLGAESVRANGPEWITQLNAKRHQLSRAFSYEYSAS